MVLHRRDSSLSLDLRGAGADAGISSVQYRVIDDGLSSEVKIEIDGRSSV